MSPIGIRVAPSNDDGETLNSDSVYGKDFGPPEWLRPVITYLWTHRKSPFNLGRILGQITSKKLIDNYVASRYSELLPDEKKLIANYLYHILLRDNPPETSIQIMFTPSM